MSLTVTGVSPTSGATDVVLGISIVITFSELINTSTLNKASFSLTCPGGTQVITPGSLITRVPNTLNTNQFVLGAFSFATVGGVTVATFVPSTPLNPNTTYTVLVVGSNSIFAAPNAVQDLSGNPLANSYTWTFSTGNLNVSVPPPSSPLAGPITTFIQTDQIQVSPLRPLINQNLDAGYYLTITFPAPIDTTSFNVNQVVVSVGAILDDPTVMLSQNLTATASINPSNAAQLIITITDA
jgi:hypothetical protein